MTQSAVKLNAMTVDVEDYFHVSAFEKQISPSDWASCKPTVDYNTRRLLDIYAEHNTKATFFTLGWVAQAFPQLIKDIHAQGHEIASHGSNHRRATTMSREELKTDIKDSVDLMEDLTGEKILGYRAPSFSIDKSNEWAFELLAELGFKYSSSTYPIAHDLYGTPDWPRFAYKRPEGILEIPIPTVKKGDKNQGIGGGGYFRLYPYWLSKKRINKFLAEENAPYSFYFHPWEIDPNQPKVKNAPLLSKFRHYVNLSSMEGKLISLLNDYNWSTMKEAYAEHF